MKAVFFLFIQLFLAFSLFPDIYEVKAKIVDQQLLTENDIEIIEQELEYFTKSTGSQSREKSAALFFCLENLVKDNIETIDLQKDNLARNRKKRDIDASIFLGSAVGAALLSSVSFLGGYFSYNAYANTTITKKAELYRGLTVAGDVFGGLFATAAVPLLITSIYYYSTGEDRAEYISIKKNHKIYKSYYLVR